MFSDTGDRQGRARIGFFPRTEEKHYIVQPEGLQAGSLKPPEPEGMPWGRNEAADISLITSLQAHCGHSGGGSAGDKISCSKQ